MELCHLSWDEAHVVASRVAEKIRFLGPASRNIRLYGIPNGGIPAVLLVAEEMSKMGGIPLLVECPEHADCYVDDIIDSGATKERFQKINHVPFFSLIDKQKENKGTGYWVFPWERMQKQEGPEDNIRRILQFIGEDATREGLRDTPARVVRSYAELYAGYKQDPKDVMKVFEDGVTDEMIILKNVEFYSMCEHHMLPFSGRAHIAYIPDGKIIGISKLARLLEIYSRRLQVQERLTQQITSALDEHLKPRGSACVVEASHSCMTCRGIGKQHSTMITSSLTGVFRQLEVRSEFLSMIRG